MNHPEAPEGIKDIIEFVEKTEITDVWCNGCQMYRQMNAAYSKYVSAGLESCRFCRNGGMLN